MRESSWRLPRKRDAAQAGLAGWLRDRGSLTARLSRHGRFSVNVCHEGWRRPLPDEFPLLGTASRELVRTREVVLCCDGVPVVFAHTVLGPRPRGALTLWFKRVGKRSLGALLFAHPGIRRGTLEARRLDRRHPLFDPAASAFAGHAPVSRELWARRSRFGFGRQTLLVSEVFSPAVADLVDFSRPKNSLDSGARFDYNSAPSPQGEC